MKVSDRVAATLVSVGAKLKRQKKHLVYELPNGRNVVTASTPSDYRAELNMIADIKKAAGVEREVKPPRTPREKKPGRAESAEVWTIPQQHSPMAAALRDTGLVEAGLRAQITELEGRISELRWKVLHQEERIAKLQSSRFINCLLWLTGRLR